MTIGERDRAILAAMQDGTTKLTDIAEDLGVHPATVSRAVGKLEGAGVIEGYTAIINPSLVGLGARALILAEIDGPGKSAFEHIERHAGDTEAIIAAHRIIGSSSDYVFDVLGVDFAAIAEVHGEIRDLPSIGRTICMPVVETMKEHGRFPIPRGE